MPPILKWESNPLLDECQKEITLPVKNLDTCLQGYLQLVHFI